MPLPPSAQCVQLKASTPCSWQKSRDRLDLGIGVGDEMIDGDGDRHAELLHVLDMAAEIGEALLQRLDILLLEIVLGRRRHAS